jgi:hypothetical protein
MNIIASVGALNRKKRTIIDLFSKACFVQHLLQKNHSASWRNLFIGKGELKLYGIFFANAAH